MALEFAEFLRNFVPLGIGVDPDALSENTLLEELVAGGKTVLEVVRGETLTDGLSVGGCSVTMVDVAEFEAAEASTGLAASRVTYDVVVLSDVLAYVREPVRLLRQCRRVLNPNGFVVAVMPNFGYGALRLALLSGTYDEFAREQEANPRLHFFTLELIENLLMRAGYRIEQTMRRTMPWDGALKEPRYAELEEVLLTQIRRDPEHETVTYLIKSAPVVQALPDTPQREADVEAMKRRVEEVEAQLDAAATENAELREAGRALREQVAGLRRRARTAVQFQTALDSALMDLASAFTMRDQLLSHVHAADIALNELIKARADLERSHAEIERAAHGLRQQNAGLAKRAESAERAAQELHQQNAGLAKRAESAERAALQLANEMLQSTKTEIQQLSSLIDVVQRSFFWRLKFFFGRLRGLLVR